MDLKDDKNNFIRRFYKEYENLKSVLTYILGLGMMAFLIFIVYPVQEKGSDQWSQVQHSFFLTFNRLTFVFSLFIFMIPQIFLDESAIREINGSRFFNPTAKLAYCIYLVHYVFIWILFYNVRQSIYYTNLEFFSRAVEVLFISFFAAIILHLLVEKPIANLEKMLEGSGSKKIEDKPEKSELMFEEDKNENLLPK